MFPQLRMGSSFCKTEQLTPSCDLLQVWQVGSSRQCHAEEVPGITTVEEVQTGQVKWPVTMCH